MDLDWLLVRAPLPLSFVYFVCFVADLLNSYGKTSRVGFGNLARFQFTTTEALLVCAFLVARMAELADATDSKSVAL